MTTPRIGLRVRPPPSLRNPALGPLDMSPFSGPTFLTSNIQIDYYSVHDQWSIYQNPTVGNLVRVLVNFTEVWSNLNPIHCMSKKHVSDLDVLDV